MTVVSPSEKYHLAHQQKNVDMLDATIVSIRSDLVYRGSFGGGRGKHLSIPVDRNAIKEKTFIYNCPERAPLPGAAQIPKYFVRGKSSNYLLVILAFLITVPHLSSPSRYFWVPCEFRNSTWKPRSSTLSFNALS